MPEAAQLPPHAAQEQDDRDILPSFQEDLLLREMKASFTFNKGALTRLSNQVKVRAETFVAIKSPGSESQLNESYKFLTKCQFLHREAHQLALAYEANAQTWLAAQDQLQPLQNQIEHIYGDTQVQLGVAAPPPETGGIAPSASWFRVLLDLKPWDLESSATPTEFRR